LKKPNHEKKPIKILKKPTGSVRFYFYKPETKKTEPNPNKQKPEKKPSQTGKKPSQTRKNRVKLKKLSQTGLNRFLSKKSNRTKTSQFEPVSVFFFNSVWFFFYKNRTEPKMITPTFNYTFNISNTNKIFFR
jgi:hypothetical protein